MRSESRRSCSCTPYLECAGDLRAGEADKYYGNVCHRSAVRYPRAIPPRPHYQGRYPRRNPECLGAFVLQHSRTIFCAPRGPDGRRDYTAYIACPGRLGLSVHTVKPFPLTIDFRRSYPQAKSRTPAKPEAEIPEEINCPDYAHLLPTEIQSFTTKGVYDLDDSQHLSFTQGAGHGGSHPHLVHAFIDALIKGDQPYPNAVESANITCVGILAHESALNGGEIIKLPAFTLKSNT